MTNRLTCSLKAAQEIGVSKRHWHRLIRVAKIRPTVIRRKYYFTQPQLQVVFGKYHRKELRGFRHDGETEGREAEGD